MHTHLDNNARFLFNYFKIRKLVTQTYPPSRSSRLYKIQKVSKKIAHKIPLCIKSTHIGSLFRLTSQSVGINMMRTQTNKVYFAVSFNQLSSQFAEKWATQFWALFPFLREIQFFSNIYLEHESVCLINWFNIILHNERKKVSIPLIMSAEKMQNSNNVCVYY